METWKVNEAKTKEQWLQLEDPDGWYSASVKWDGCIHFARCFNVPHSFDDDKNTDYIHICDVDDMIQRLQALKVEAVKHFGQNWPE